MPVGTLADTAVMIGPCLYPAGTKSAAAVEVITRLQVKLSELPCTYPYRLWTVEQK